ncbi:hypothetical protein ACMHYB_43750 [Sorangium sp. So ce1128]
MALGQPDDLRRSQAVTIHHGGVDMAEEERVIALDPLQPLVLQRDREPMQNPQWQPQCSTASSLEAVVLALAKISLISKTHPFDSINPTFLDVER